MDSSKVWPFCLGSSETVAHRPPSRATSLDSALSSRPGDWKSRLTASQPPCRPLQSILGMAAGGRQISALFRAPRSEWKLRVPVLARKALHSLAPLTSLAPSPPLPTALSTPALQLPGLQCAKHTPTDASLSCCPFRQQGFPAPPDSHVTPPFFVVSV